MKNITDSVKTFLISIPVYMGYGVLFLFAPFMISLLIPAWTGEVLRFLLTMGHHKPVWSLDSMKSSSVFTLFTEVSLYLGVTFWVYSRSLFEICSWKRIASVNDYCPSWRFGLNELYMQRPHLARRCTESALCASR